MKVDQVRFRDIGVGSRAMHLELLAPPQVIAR